MIESNKREKVSIEYRPCFQSRMRLTEKPKHAENDIYNPIFFLIFLTSMFARIWLPNFMTSASPLA